MKLFKGFEEQYKKGMMRLGHNCVSFCKRIHV